MTQINRWVPTLPVTTTMDPTKWVPVVHRGCGEKAFEINVTFIDQWYRMRKAGARMPWPNIRSEWVRMPDGQHPEHSSRCECGACGNGVEMKTIKASHLLRADENSLPVMVD